MTKILAFTLSFLLMMGACSNGNKEADNVLSMAREYYSEGNYLKAKELLDSIHTQHPKAFGQRKIALALLDSVRYSENESIITETTLKIEDVEKQVQLLKKNFVLKKNTAYEDEGTYLTKSANAQGMTNTLRAGVTETGKSFLESVWVSGGKHNKITISTNTGESLSSKVVNRDGANYRFASMGKQYEIIKFSGEDENGLIQFIVDNQNENLKMLLSGANNHTLILSGSVKKSIAQTAELAKVIQQLDSMRNAVDNAQTRNLYLDNGKQTTLKTDSIQVIGSEN